MRYGQRARVISTKQDILHHDINYQMAPLTVRIMTAEERNKYGVGQITRVCKVCGEKKPIEMFGKNKSCRDGINKTCKICVNKKQKERNKQKKSA